MDNTTTEIRSKGCLLVQLSRFTHFEPESRLINLTLKTPVPYTLNGRYVTVIIACLPNLKCTTFPPLGNPWIEIV